MLIDVKHARLALGLSQGELADLLGLHQSTVSCWETGERNPKRPAVMCILALLRDAGIDPAAIHHTSAAE